jgi:hypothetical protein
MTLKGKPIERWGRKASGLKVTPTRVGWANDSGVAGGEESSARRDRAAFR